MSNITKRAVVAKGEKRGKKLSKDEQSHPAFAYGTDAEFLEWVSYQPSVLDGKWNQVEIGIGRNIACHVRRQKDGAGMGKKPPFSAVPMTDKQHRHQTKYGEVSVLGEYDWLLIDGAMVGKKEAAAWFEKARDVTLNNWIKSKENGNDDMD